MAQVGLRVDAGDRLRGRLLHLETDASLNMRRPQLQSDGSTRYFAGGGIVVRSESMELVQQTRVPLGFVRSIDEAEGRAVLQALSIASGLGAKGAVVRTDSARIIQLVENGHTNPPERLSELGEQLREAIASMLGGVTLRHSPSFHQPTRRDGAASADTLARTAAGLGGRTWRPRRRRHGPLGGA